MPTVKSVAAKKAARARSTLNAYRRLFSTEDGKEVLKDMMQSCHFFSPTLGKDSHETYFNEGMRAAVLRLMSTAHLNEQSIEQLANAINAEKADDYLD